MVALPTWFRLQMFAFGITLYSLITGVLTPYAEVPNLMDLIGMIIAGTVDLRQSVPALPAAWTPLKDIMLACLDRDPTRRPTAAAAEAALRTAMQQEVERPTPVCVIPCNVCVWEGCVCVCVCVCLFQPKKAAVEFDKLV